jgi:hypothetical protein
MLRPENIDTSIYEDPEGKTITSLLRLPSPRRREHPKTGIIPPVSIT